MLVVSVHEAKSHLLQLLVRVAAGEEVVISRSGKPVARLVPYSSSARRMLGGDEGLFEIPDDFDEASEELADLFEAGSLET